MTLKEQMDGLLYNFKSQVESKLKIKRGSTFFPGEEGDNFDDIDKNEMNESDNNNGDDGDNNNNDDDAAGDDSSDSDSDDVTKRPQGRGGGGARGRGGGRRGTRGGISGSSNVSHHRRQSGHAFKSLGDEKFIHMILDSKIKGVGKRLSYLLATGNLRSRSGLDLMQVTGFTIQAERLNFLRFGMRIVYWFLFITIIIIFLFVNILIVDPFFRFISHFRSVHRGHFFTERKTTEVRKLLPQAWGFICPVHTPDGTPCGLLNHLAAKYTFFFFFLCVCVCVLLFFFFFFCVCVFCYFFFFFCVCVCVLLFFFFIPRTDVRSRNTRRARPICC
jgi:hypothetical protein